MKPIALLAVSAFLILSALIAQAFAGPNEDILAASKAGDRAAVEGALARGASVNAWDEEKLTPLALSATHGHKNVATFLLDSGANLDAKDILGRAPLHLAAESGNADVAALLLSRGADVNARDLFGGTPLGWAGLRGQKNVAALLIARGALVDARSVTGKTPLHLAAAAGQKEVVILLLAHGANRNVRNADGQTPLDEMEASDLDPASKASVAAVLRATAPKSVPARPVMTTPAPGNTPSVPVTQVPNSMPACTDLGGIARLVMQANPQADYKSDRGARVLYHAVMQYQVAMGCRPEPQTTKCTWIGDVWTCKTN